MMYMVIPSKQLVAFRRIGVQSINVRLKKSQWFITIDGKNRFIWWGTVNRTDGDHALVVVLVGRALHRKLEYQILGGKIRVRDQIFDQQEKPVDVLVLCLDLAALAGVLLGDVFLVVEQPDDGFYRTRRVVQRLGDLVHAADERIELGQGGAHCDQIAPVFLVRFVAELLDGNVADSPPGSRDRPYKRRIIVVVDRQTEVGEDVLDLLRLEQSLAAPDHVGDAEPDECALQVPDLHGAADQDGVILVTDEAVALQLIGVMNLLGDDDGHVGRSRGTNQPGVALVAGRLVFSCGVDLHPAKIIHLEGDDFRHGGIDLVGQPDDGRQAPMVADDAVQDRHLTPPAFAELLEQSRFGTLE